ncbi:hypothetical protein DXC58_05925 [Ruminococcus sp. TF06-23]|nr:hypothetical protein DXC58_05925 [Ruminococcus sp. TF06-23]
MGKNSNVPVLIKYVNDLEHTWGMYRNVLADWLDTAGSTITGWKDYKWTQVSEGQIKLVALYCGESIRNANDLKEEFRKLAEEEGANGDSIVNVIEKLDDAKLKKAIDEVHEKVVNEYLKKERESSTGASERIKNFIKEKYPSFFERTQIQYNDTNKPSKNTDNDTPVVEDSPKSSENTDNDTPATEDNPEPPKDTDNDTPTVEDSPKLLEDTDNDKPAVEDNPEPSENTDNDTPAVEDSPKLLEDTDNDTPEKEDKIKSSPRESDLLKTQGEYGKATELGEHIEYLMCAAEVGDKDANFKLGLAYKDGEGVIRNFSKAVEYFFEAGKLGSEAAVYELKECYRNRLGVEKKQAGRKEMWLRMVLKANHYKCKKPSVDISMDSKLSSKERFKYVKKWHDFIPETDEERKLKELIEIWGGVK